MTDWTNDPNLNQDWATRDNAIKSRDESNARMDYTGDTNIPDGTIRWSSATQRFEIWDATTQTWSELSTEYAINVAQLKGAQPDTEPTNNTIVKRLPDGSFKATSAAIGPNAGGHGPIYCKNSSGAYGNIVKTSGGNFEFRCFDATGVQNSAWVASENGWLSGWSSGSTKMAYNPGGSRWEFYHGAGDYSGGSFARYISWKVAESETNKVCYVDQVNGDDATAEPGNSAKPFKSLSAAAKAVPQGGRTTIQLLSNYTLTYDEDISGRQVVFDLNGYQLSTQWYTSTISGNTYAAAYRIWSQCSQIYFRLDTRNGTGSQIYIPRRDATLATYPLQPTRSGLFYAPQDAPASFSFTIRADSTSTVPPIYVGDGYLIHTNTWSYDHYPRLSVSIGAHYGSAAAANAIVLDKTNMDTRLVQSSYACDYSFQGSVAEGGRLFVDQAGNKISHADAVLISADTTYNRAARSINYYFSDGSHPGNTWGECGNVFIYDSAGTYTYTPTAGIRGIVVTLVGGGGGGGSGEWISTAVGEYWLLGGNSGEQGGLIRFWVPASVLTPGVTFEVGAGGNGGLGGTQQWGTSGGNTTMTINGSQVAYAVGGNGGKSGSLTDYAPTSNLEVSGDVSLTDAVILEVRPARESDSQGQKLLITQQTDQVNYVASGGERSMYGVGPYRLVGSSPVLAGIGGTGGYAQLVSGVFAGLSGQDGSNGAVMIEEYF